MEINTTIAIKEFNRIEAFWAAFCYIFTFYWIKDGFIAFELFIYLNSCNTFHSPQYDQLLKLLVCNNTV